jgi:photosystem II reaction center protein PsbP
VAFRSFSVARAHPVGMANRRLPALLSFAAVGAFALLGCGGGGSSSSTSAVTHSTSSTQATAVTTTNKTFCGSSTAAASSESGSTAQGDIPDNQQFLAYKNHSGGYSISYPQGWARSGNGNQVTFQDKSNTVTIKVSPGLRPTAASVSAELKQEAAADPCLSAGKPQSTTAGPNQVVKVTYATEGQKSPVTGQRPKITVDRYVYFRGGKVATVDLATPVGVDNVDAYRMISESFRWS